MTAPLDLAALRALVEQATRGPWQVDLERERHALKEVCVVFGTDIKSAMVPAIRSKGPLRRSPLTTEATQTANLHLIVAAVNALPALLDELEALRADRERLDGLEAMVRPGEGHPRGADIMLRGGDDQSIAIDHGAWLQHGHSVKRSEHTTRAPSLRDALDMLDRARGEGRTDA